MGRPTDTMGTVRRIDALPQGFKLVACDGCGDGLRTMREAWKRECAQCHIKVCRICLGEQETICVKCRGVVA